MKQLATADPNPLAELPPVVNVSFKKELDERYCVYDNKPVLIEVYNEEVSWPPRYFQAAKDCPSGLLGTARQPGTAHVASQVVLPSQGLPK